MSKRISFNAVQMSQGSGHSLQVATSNENIQLALINFINQLLENLSKEKCILHLEIICGV